jgi:aspartyl protease family protein
MIRDAASGAIALMIVSFGAVHFLSNRPEPGPQETKTETIATAQTPIKAPAPTASGGYQIVLEADAHGHYAAEMMVDGTRFPALVDTGATVVALPMAVAGQIGIFPGPEQFTQRVSTANGELKVAPVRLSNVTLGPIRLHDVDAVVIPEGRLDKTLLGMSFLGRLKRFEIRDGKLHLSN